MRFPPTPPDEAAADPRLDTPPVLGLPSPDYTPPTAVGAKVHMGDGRLLKTPRPAFLTFDNDSRAESFITAREEPSMEHLTLFENRGGPVQLPMSIAGGAGGESLDMDSDGRSTPKPDFGQHELPRTPSPVRDGVPRAVPDRAEKRSSTPPSGGSVRRKPYRDNASESGTAGSRDATRSKSYQMVGSSEAGSAGSEQYESWEKHVSYVHSDDEDLRGESPSPASRNSAGGAPPDDDAWEKHISYISFDGPTVTSDQVSSPVAMNPNTGELSSIHLRGKGSKRSGHGMNTGKVRSSNTRGLSDIARSDELPQERKHSLHRVPHLDALQPPPLNITVRKKRLPQPSTIGVVDDSLGDSEPTVLRDDLDFDESSQILSSYQHNADELDLIYRHIRTANMDRFDALQSGKAVEAKVISAQDAMGHALRRVSKCHSLRTASDASSVNSGDLLPRDVHGRNTVKEPEPSVQSLSQAIRPSRRAEILSGQYDPKASNLRAVSNPVPPRQLRRERRILSDTIKNRPMEVYDATLRAKLRKGNQTSEVIERPAHQLRHTSMPASNKSKSNRAMSLVAQQGSSHENEAFEHGLRRHSRDYRLEKLSMTDHAPRLVEVDRIVSPITPQFLGISAHQHSRSMATIASQSQWSANAELCEASNMEIFPHSNKSVMVVDNASRPTSKDKEQSLKDGYIDEDNIAFRGPYHDFVDKSFIKRPTQPTFALNGQDMQAGDGKQVPQINCIPPTPNSELDRQLISPEKRPSLASHVRRFSEMLFPRRQSISQEENDPRNISLHPNWRPSYATSYSTDSVDSLPEMGQDFDTLPRGGDTSDHPTKFPRKLSVRMPGFRGTGGFSQGNSLGIDRHGTNVRRHWVDGQRVKGNGKKGFSIPGTSKRVVFVGLGGLTGRK
nr:hypothetical protein B0A51_07013 [Rachicladosporium sp. CCFEE 5018]